MAANVPLPTDTDGPAHPLHLMHCSITVFLSHPTKHNIFIWSYQRNQKIETLNMKDDSLVLWPQHITQLPWWQGTWEDRMTKIILNLSWSAKYPKHTSCHTQLPSNTHSSTTKWNTLTPFIVKFYTVTIKVNRWWRNHFNLKEFQIFYCLLLCFCNV